MLSATKQAISIKLATMVGLFFFLHDLDRDFENVYMAAQLVYNFLSWY